MQGDRKLLRNPPLQIDTAPTHDTIPLEVVTLLDRPPPPWPAAPATTGPAGHCDEDNRTTRRVRDVALAEDASRIREAMEAGHEREFWAFDSFRGLPKSATQLMNILNGKREHTLSISPSMRDGCVWVVSRTTESKQFRCYYAESLHGPNAQRLGEVALAYIDCDLFTSTLEVMRFLGPRIRNGVVLAFDDYFCHTREGRSGEQLAFEQFRFKIDQFEFDSYLPIGWHGKSFIAYRKVFTG